jgi:hypothetical protein
MPEVKTREEMVFATQGFNGEDGGAKMFVAEGRKAIQKVWEDELKEKGIVGVRVFFPHNYTSEPARDTNIITVQCWSSPSERKPKVHPPDSVLGCRVSCPDRAFQASGEGIALVDSKTGYCYAEVVGWNIYIHHDITHFHNEGDIKLFGKILKKAIKHLGAPTKEVDIVPHMKRSWKSRHSSDKESLEYHIRCKDDDIRSRQNTIKTRIKEKAKLEKRLAEMPPPTARDFAGDIEFVRNHPVVKSSVMTKRGLTLITHPIVTYELDDGTVRRIGEVEIQLLVNGDYPLMRRADPTERDKLLLPHQMDYTGRMCWGDSIDVVATMSRNLTWDQLIELLPEFIKRPYTADSAGAKVYRYPSEKGESLKGISDKKFEEYQKAQEGHSRPETYVQWDRRMKKERAELARREKERKARLAAEKKAKEKTVKLADNAVRTPDGATTTYVTVTGDPLAGIVFTASTDDDF